MSPYWAMRCGQSWLMKMSTFSLTCTRAQTELNQGPLASSGIMQNSVVDAAVGPGMAHENVCPICKRCVVDAGAARHVCAPQDLEFITAWTKLALRFSATQTWCADARIKWTPVTIKTIQKSAQLHNALIGQPSRRRVRTPLPRSKQCATRGARRTLSMRYTSRSRTWYALRTVLRSYGGDS